MPSVDDIVSWITDLMSRLGAPGVGVAVAAENLFPPIPSEVVLPLAGFTAGLGEMSVVAAVVWATAGSLGGALALYGLGAALGRRRLGLVYERLPLTSESDLTKADDWFARHGAAAVFFGRMIPLVRSFISIPAGIERMPLPRFLLYTAAGSLLWNTAFITAGFLLGERWTAVERYVAPVGNAVLVLAVAVVLGVGVRRLLARRASPRP